MPPSPIHFSASLSPLENSGQPSQECVKRLRIEEEIRHTQKRYEDEQGIDPIPDGWPQFRHRREYRRIGPARKPTIGAIEFVALGAGAGAMQLRLDG